MEPDSKDSGDKKPSDKNQTTDHSKPEPPEDRKIIRAEKPLGVKPQTGFNLKTLFDKVEEEKPEEEDLNNRPAGKFTAEALKENWNLFLETLRLENKIPSYNALQSGSLELKDNFIIDISFNSSSTIHEFEQLKDRLILFLREKLNNHIFEFNTVLLEGETENLIKSKDEIFREMAEQNPVLLKLKKELGLDYNS